jgi:hypothetical protein
VPRGEPDPRGDQSAKERAERMNLLKLDVDQYPKVAAQLVLVCNTYPEKGGF